MRGGDTMDGGDDDLALHPIRSIAIGYRDTAPEFAATRRAEIEARWTAEVAANPALFNGTVLLFEDVALSDGTLTATGVPIDYAGFSAFKAWGGPEPRLMNLFGAAAIVSAEGHLLLGRMAQSTDDPGMVKLAGGTPDRADIVDGRVDIVASIARELAEETGLCAEDASAGELLAHIDFPSCAIMQVLRFPASTADLVARMSAHLAASEAPELSGIAVARTRSDGGVLGSPRYTRAIARHLLPA
ncbi:NUDIX hydrolase [Amorphus sp. MBR-141]